MNLRWPAAVMFGLLRLAAESPPASGVIQSAELGPTRPYFIPTHPRVTTTVRFPDAIGAPEGAVSVFTEDAARHQAEYLVNWQAGDAHFTVAPLRDARLANLNVPYQGRTYVVYLYPVTDPMLAVAAFNLQPPRGEGPTRDPSDPPVVVNRSADPPVAADADAGPAQLVGFIDRLKLLHATAPGPALDAMVAALDVEIAAGTGTGGDGLTAAPARVPALSDAGLYQVVLLYVVRDPRLNCLGFICLLRNVSSETLWFDVTSFGARAGVEYLSQRISDATPELPPREQRVAYFVVQPPRRSPLRAHNAWRLSVDLVSPRLNPGAAIARGFVRRPTP